MSHGFASSDSYTSSKSRSRHRNQHRRAQHRRHEEAKQNLQAQPPSSRQTETLHRDQFASSSRGRLQTHTHNKPGSTSTHQEGASSSSNSLTKSKSTSSCTTVSAKLGATSTGHRSVSTNSLHTSISSAKNRPVEYSANTPTAGWEFRPHIPLVLALTCCGIIILLLVAGLSFVMLWRRRTAKLNQKRTTRERRAREDGRREGLEMRLEGLGIELEGIGEHEGDQSFTFEGRDKDGRLVEGIAVRDGTPIYDGWKDVFQEKSPTPMVRENWNQGSLIGSSTIPSPKAAFISSVHHHQSNQATGCGGSWKTLIPRKGKGVNDFQGTIEQYSYTPDITVESSSGSDMWSNIGGAEKGYGHGLGIGVRSHNNTPGSPPIADGWGGFVKGRISSSAATVPSLASNGPPNQPGRPALSSITVHQYERFGKAFDESNIALDLAPACSDAYAAAASKSFSASPRQINNGTSSSRMERFALGVGATMAAGADLTRKLSRKLDVRRSVKLFSISDRNANQPQVKIPSPVIYQLSDTPAIGELEYVTAPLPSPGMANPFETAFAKPTSSSGGVSNFISPAMSAFQTPLRPTLDRFDSAASTLVPSRASQPSSSLGRKGSSTTTVLEDQEDGQTRSSAEGEVEAGVKIDEMGEGVGGDELNSRLSSSTIERGLLWRTLPGGALRDGEPLGVAQDDQLMAISASSSETSLLLRRESSQGQNPPTAGGIQDSPIDPRQISAFRFIKGLSRSEEVSKDQVSFGTEGSKRSDASTLKHSSAAIGLGISVTDVAERGVEDVVEEVYRSVQQLVREGLGTSRKRARTASAARSLKFPEDGCIDPEYSIGAITIRSRSATIDSTRASHYPKGTKRSGTNETVHSTLARRRANSEGRRRTLVTDEMDRFYPGARSPLQNRSRKSSAASSLAVPTTISVGSRSSLALKGGEVHGQRLSSASSASIWSKESRPSSYVPIFDGQESRNSLQPPPVPEKDANSSPQLNAASTALKNFFDSPAPGKRQRVDISTSSPQSSFRFSPFGTPSTATLKVSPPSIFASIESPLPALPSSTSDKTVNLKNAAPVGLNMKQEHETPARAPANSTQTLASKGDRAQMSRADPVADTWPNLAGNDSPGSPVPSRESASLNAVRNSSSFDPRMSGSFLTKSTTRHRFSHTSHTPVLTVTEAFVSFPSSDSPHEEGPISSYESNAQSTHSSTPMQLLSSSPNSPLTLHRSRTTSGDSRRSRENSFGDEPSKSPRTRPRGATIPAPRAALRGARAAAAALAAASALQSKSGTIGDLEVESSRPASPRVAFAPLENDTRPSSRPSSPRVAFADETVTPSSSISASISASPSKSKSRTDLKTPMCSSPLKKGNTLPVALNPPSSGKKDLKKRGVQSMSTSRRRAPSKLRIDTSAGKQTSSSDSPDGGIVAGAAEDIVTPILAGGDGSDNSMSSDNAEDEVTTPTSIRAASVLPYAQTPTKSGNHSLRVQGDTMEELRIGTFGRSKTNSFMSTNLSNGPTSLKRARATSARSSDYASPTMLVFRFYESETDEY